MSTPELRKILKDFKVKDREVCYIGDDVIDLPVLMKVGLRIAVANAVPQVKKVAHYITKNQGGRGAVREITDMLLTTQKKWKQVLQPYFQA